MKPSTSKLILAVATAAVTCVGDLAGQLASGQLVNAQRSVLIGLGIGAFVRLAGVVLAWYVKQAAAAATLDTSHQDQQP